MDICGYCIWTRAYIFIAELLYDEGDGLCWDIVGRALFYCYCCTAYCVEYSVRYWVMFRGFRYYSVALFMLAAIFLVLGVMLVSSICFKTNDLTLCG